MNVFVLCTGRCGSTTFYEACRHLTNFTAGHESRIKLLGDARIDYPVNHIESDNRLAWFLGRLDAKYGRDAYYVHLTREPAKVARSLLAQHPHPAGIVPGYKRTIVRGAMDASDMDAALDYIRTVTENITQFLRDKPNVMHMQVESLAQQFPDFLSWIGAEGDLNAACREVTVRHNVMKPVRLSMGNKVLKVVGLR